MSVSLSGLIRCLRGPPRQLRSARTFPAFPLSRFSPLFLLSSFPVLCLTRPSSSEKKKWEKQEIGKTDSNFLTVDDADLADDRMFSDFPIFDVFRFSRVVFRFFTFSLFHFPAFPLVQLLVSEIQVFRFLTFPLFRFSDFGPDRESGKSGHVTMGNRPSPKAARTLTPTNGRLGRTVRIQDSRQTASEFLTFQPRFTPTANGVLTTLKNSISYY